MLRTKLLPFIVAASLAIAPQSEAQTGEPALVEIDGTALNIHAIGLDEPRDAKIVVVFESGFGTPLQNWSTLSEKVAQFAPVIAYDRAGIGASPIAADGPQIENSVARLERVIQTTAPDAEIILVGHSWGGLLARRYASSFPDRIAGLVLIDPTDPAQTEARERELFLQAGAPQEAYDKFYLILMSGIGSAPDGVKAELAVIDQFRRTNPGLDESEKLPEVPIAVFLGAKLSIPPQMGEATGIDIARFGQVMLAERMRSLGNLVAKSPDGTLVVEMDAGHFVHRDKPDLVLNQIRQMVEAAGDADQSP